MLPRPFAQVNEFVPPWSRFVTSSVTKEAGLTAEGAEEYEKRPVLPLPA
jgi:hypothetical protein